MIEIKFADCAAAECEVKHLGDFWTICWSVLSQMDSAADVRLAWSARRRTRRPDLARRPAKKSCGNSVDTPGEQRASGSLLS